MVEKRVSRGILEYEIVDRYPRVSQFVLEVEITDQTPRMSQFVLEVEVPAIASGTYFFADAEIALFAIVFQNITADAEILALGSVNQQFSADAEIAPLFTQQKTFTADAQIESRKAFDADAYIQKIVPCPSVWYDDIDGPYEVWAIDHDGNLLTDPITQFERLEINRAVNGQWHHGYGDYILQVSPELVDTSVITLDTIISVRRITSSGDVVKVFEGLHRKRRDWHDESGAGHFITAGPDYKHLMKRRVVLPWPTGRAFFSVTDNFTDIMRLLAVTNAQAAAGVDRWFNKFKVEANTNEGQTLSMHYRNTYLNEDIDALADLGADWDIIRENSNQYRFRVFFPFKGRDRRRGNACGNSELVFSIDNDNIIQPQYDEDRVDEATVVYVAGDGIGTDRDITERHNINDRESDSEWNRTERFFEQTKETSPAALAAWGDAFLVENGIQRRFGLRLLPEQEYAYGVDWNLGDKCTGVYQGLTFHMRIVEVRVVLDPEAGREVTPMMFVYPTLEDY